MTISVTITQPNVTDSYGRVLVVGATYTLGDDLAKSLIGQGKGTASNTFPAGVYPVPLNPPYVDFQAGFVGGLVPNDQAATAQNTALIQAALNIGGLVQIPYGTFYVNALTIPAGSPCTIRGAGSSDAYAATNGGAASNGTQGAVYANESEIAATSLIFTSTTGVLFTVLAHGVTMENFHMSNQAGTEPSAGSAVQVGQSGTPANGFRMQGCSTNRFYIGVDIVNCDAYAIAFNKIIGSVKGGIRTQNTENQDEGDPIITGNWIMSGKNSVAPDYGILYNGGGGLKIIGNKISRKGATAAADAKRTKKGILLQPPSGVTSSVFTITGNSIEAMDEDCIYIDATSASVGNICISGNEFNCSPSLTNYVLRGIAGSFVPGIVYFGNNTINGCYTMVKSNYFSGLNIGPNTIEGSLLGGPLIDIDNAINVGYRLDEQLVKTRGSNVVMLKDTTGTNYNSNSQRSSTNKRVVREMPAFATTSTTVNLFKIDMSQPGAATLGNIVEVEIAFSGYASALGPFSFRGRRFIYSDGANSAAVSTPTGWSDICYAPGASVTSAAYLTLGSSTASGVVTLTFTGVPAASTPNLSTSPFAGVFSGEVRMTVDGTVKQLVIC